LQLLLLLLRACIGVAVLCCWLLLVVVWCSVGRADEQKLMDCFYVLWQKAR
jgi:hypothetical protein